MLFVAFSRQAEEDLTPVASSDWGPRALSLSPDRRDQVIRGEWRVTSPRLSLLLVRHCPNLQQECRLLSHHLFSSVSALDIIGSVWISLLDGCTPFRYLELLCRPSVAKALLSSGNGATIVTSGTTISIPSASVLSQACPNLSRPPITSRVHEEHQHSYIRITMPFRARLKNAFRRTSTASSSSTNDSRSKKTPSAHDSSRLDPSDPSVYKPHELPRPKYKVPADRKHTARLEAFSFAGNWRRKSSGGRSGSTCQYSPGGSRLSSPRQSTSEGNIGPSGTKSAWKPGKSGVERVEESADDKGNVANGESRHRSP